MSLQVWLPLNGNLENQGLQNVTVTNNGAVVNSNGKIGSCYQFGTNASDIQLPKETMTNFTTACSVTFWIKILSWNSTWATFFQAGLSGTPWVNYTFGFLRNGSSSKCCFTISDGSSASNANYQTSDLDQNVWYHVSLIYTTGQCLIYLNGALENSYSTSIVPNFNSINSIRIGRCNNGSSYQTNCLMNDFRIYDHALSVKEVRELAKGLVLHYKLDNNGLGQENLAKDALGVWVSGLGAAAGSRAEYRSRTLGQPIPVNSGDKVRVSFDVHMEVHTSRSASARKLYVYNSNNKGPHYGWVSYECWSGRAITAGDIIDDHISFTTTVNSKSDATATNDFIEFYSEYGTSNWFSISNFHVEKGQQETPWAPNSSDAIWAQLGLGTTIYDASGYHKNGTILNSVTVTSATPRYSTSTIFNGTNAKIKLPVINFSGMANSYTFAWWQYNIGSGNMPWGFSDGNRLNVYHTSPLCWNTGDGSSNQFKDGSTTVPYSVVQNAWHHMAVTGDGTYAKLYIDGVYRGTATTYKAITGTQIYLSGWDTGTNYTFNGSKESDFRIYATALSAADVAELYHTEVAVDHNGSTWAREVVEV